MVQRNLTTAALVANVSILQVLLNSSLIGESRNNESVQAKIRWAVTHKPPCPPAPTRGRGASQCMSPDGTLSPCRPGNQICPCSGDFSVGTPQFHVRDASACVVGDPNGASFDPEHRLYHLHFQNLVGINGGITWGHVVSRDMVYWAHMPNSIWNDHAYDSADVWTGSATIVEGQVMQLYTAACRAESIGCPCQNTSTVRSQTTECNSIALAFPSDKRDRLQTNWSKLSAPIVNNTGRDPSTAWRVNAEWRITTFDQMIYGSLDFRQWYALGRQTNFTAGECPSVFELPRNTTGAGGVAPAGSRMPNFVHKCSHSGRDWMQVGTYSAAAGELGRFVPTQGVYTGASIAGELLPWRGQSFCIDVGDFGASKDFYDPVKERRINWGTARIPPYHVQTLPREVTWHPVLQQLMFHPLEELRALRGRLLADITSTVLQPGQWHSLGLWPGSVGNQSEIIASFSLPARGNVTFGIGLMTEDAVPTVEAYVDYIDAGDKSHHLQHRQALRVGLRWPNGTAFGGKSATDKYTTLLPMLSSDHEIEIRIFYDNTFAEIFWMGGRAVITAAIPATKEAGYVAFARGGDRSATVVAKRIQAFRMNSIWVPVDQIVAGISD